MMTQRDDRAAAVTGWSGRVLRFLTRRVTPPEGGPHWLFREEGPEEADLARVHRGEKLARVERIARIDALVATFDSPRETPHAPGERPRGDQEL